MKRGFSTWDFHELLCSAPRIQRYMNSMNLKKEFVEFGSMEECMEKAKYLLKEEGITNARH